MEITLFKIITSEHAAKSHQIFFKYQIKHFFLFKSPIKFKSISDKFNKQFILYRIEAFAFEIILKLLKTMLKIFMSYLNLVRLLLV